MAISLKSIATNALSRAPIMVIHGPPGIGKTTFAAGAKDVVFLRTEDGLGNLGVETFPELESLSDVMEALGTLYGDHDFKAMVIDSLSALEPMIWARVAEDHQKKNVEAIGYAKGYIYAMDYWREVIEACKGLSRKGIMPILIAHTDIVRFESPEVEPYDRYQIKLHKKAFQYLYEQADIIGFANYPVHVKKQDAEARKGRGVQKGERSLHLIDTPAYVAKNRYSLPEKLPLQWEAFEEALIEATKQ